MKNLFKFVVIVMMLVAAPMINAQKKPVRVLIPSIDIDIVTGTKSLVNNRVICLGGGICSIKISIGLFRTSGVSVDDRGDIYLTINEEVMDESLKNDFVLTEDVDMENSDIETINNEARKINPDAKIFTGLKRGYRLHPEKIENFYYIKIN